MKSIGKLSQSAAALGVVLTLSACGPGTVINGNPSSVIVRREGSAKDATEVAAKHCAQYGKGIRMIQYYGTIMSFDCVDVAAN